jgi:hypothetical protein
LNDVTQTNGGVEFFNGSKTLTWSTGTVAGFPVDQVITLSGPVANGSARIVANGSKLICTAMLMDSTDDPPISMATLPMISKLKQKGD